MIPATASIIQMKIMDFSFEKIVFIRLINGCNFCSCKITKIKANKKMNVQRIHSFFLIKFIFVGNILR